MPFEEISVSPSSKNILINVSQSYANNLGKSLAPSPKSLKPYVNINGNANKQGYNVQVGAGVSNRIGYINVSGNTSGNWNSRPKTSVGITSGLKF